MSRIYFHSPSGEVVLSGRERAWLNKLVFNAFMSHVDLPSIGDKREDVWICDLIPKSSYVHAMADDAWRGSTTGLMNSGHPSRLAETIRTWLFVNFGADHFTWKEKKIPKFTTILNTALVVGNDVIKLAARLHGQSEIHCWVAGKNRKWLAGIMRKGLELKLLRTEEGWEGSYGYRDSNLEDPGVISFLESNDEEPVVCSFSVCEGFPGPHLADLTKLPDYHENDSDANYNSFWDLPKQQQWDLSFESLDETLEMKPENWDTYYFQDGTTLLDIKAEVREEALKRWKKEEEEREAKWKRQADGKEKPGIRDILRQKYS